MPKEKPHCVTIRHFAGWPQFKLHIPEKTPHWTVSGKGVLDMDIEVSQHGISFDAIEYKHPDHEQTRSSQKRVMFQMDEAASRKFYEFLKAHFEPQPEAPAVAQPAAETPVDRPAPEMRDGLPWRMVKDLRAGDRVDLEGDEYADVDECEEPGQGFSRHPEFAFEFETVSELEAETPECTRVDFESGFSCGFPPDHWVEVDDEQVRS